MRIPEHILQEIVDRADAETIIGRYVTLRRKGNKLWGLSPFKKEKTPSFTVDSTKKIYYCFSTAQGGSLFTFIQKMEDVEFVEAVKMLAQEVGVSIPEKQSNISNESRQEADTVHDVLQRITKTFEHFFWNEKNAAKKYMQDRGIDDDTLRAFRIGYAPPKGKKWLFSFLSKHGYKKDILSESGLFSSNYQEITLFSDRIMFPIIGTNSFVLGFGGRIISGDGPKYINSPQTKFFHKKRMLYGLFQNLKGIKEHKKVFLVEGYLDVMALYQSGVNAAVAPLGTSFTEEQAVILRRMTDEVVIVFDNDEAGKQSAIKSAITLEKLGFPAISIVMLSEKDPADILKRYGKESVREELLEQKDWFEYYLTEFTPSFNASYQEKEKALNTITEYLAAVKSEYKRTLYISRVKEVFHIDAAIIEKNIQKHQQTSQYNASKKDNETALVSNKKMTINKTTEFIAMASICKDPEFFQDIRNAIKLTDFTDTNARSIFLSLENAYREDTLTTEAVLQNLPEEIALSITELIASGEILKASHTLTENLCYHMKLGRLKKYSYNIDTQIRQLNTQIESKERDKQLNALLSEKEFYTQKILDIKKSINHSIKAN